MLYLTFFKSRLATLRCGGAAQRALLLLVFIFLPITTILFLVLSLLLGTPRVAIEGANAYDKLEGPRQQMNVDINNISIDDDENDNGIIIDLYLLSSLFSLSCWCITNGNGYGRGRVGG